MIVTRVMVVDAARRWDGTKWRHQGRHREGVDCVGLVVMVCRELGLSDYDFLAYGREPDARRFLPHFTAAGAIRIDPKAAGDGDLILFHQDGFPMHSGFLATRRGVRTVVHAHNGRRRVLEEDLRPESPIVAVFRIPGVEV